MKIAKRLTVVSALLLVAGCAHHERGGQYSEATTATAYGAGTTSSSSSSGTYSSSQAGTTTSPSASSTSSTSDSTTTPSATASSTDQSLVSQVRQTITQDSTLAAVAPQVQITAQNGIVTLSGNVSSEQEKQRIESMVKTTGGVLSVNNQLQISTAPTSDRPGQSSRLYQESSSQVATPGATSTTTPSTTTTPDSAATSTTTPDTAATTKSDATAATSATTTPSSDLTPTSQRPDASSRIYSSTTSDNLSLNIQGLTEADRTLGQKVMQELRTDTGLAAEMSNIKLNVDNGKVTLKGSVKSEDQKKNIETAIQKVTGVSSVDNQLQVSATGTSPTPASDTAPNK